MEKRIKLRLTKEEVASILVGLDSTLAEEEDDENYENIRETKKFNKPIRELIEKIEKQREASK